jgi:hypothetical protein
MNKTIEWLATVVSLVSAILTAYHYMPLNFWLGIVAGILWIIWAGKSKSYGIITVNIAFIVISIIGIYNHW